jgi:RNA polymerase sigma-70 factor (ECF subfamily)
MTGMFRLYTLWRDDWSDPARIGNCARTSRCLYRICIHVGLEYLRRRKGGQEDPTESAQCASEPSQQTVVLKNKLESAIQKLPEGCKTVFILHDIEGFNHKEISAQLLLSEGTSKSQLFKARAILRRLLVAEGRRR